MHKVLGLTNQPKLESDCKGTFVYIRQQCIANRKMNYL